MGREQETNYRGTNKLLGVVEMFNILIMVMASWAYKDVKANQMVYFKCVQFIFLQ